MEEQEHKNELLKLEERKFQFEQEKYREDKSVFKKHLPTIITAIVSISAVLISYIQFLQTDLSKSKEIEILREQKEKEFALFQAQKAKEIELLREQKDREHSIELAKFIVANKDAIYSNNNNERKLMKDIILVAYPQFGENVFRRLEQTSSDNTSKEFWKDAKAQAYQANSIILNYYASNIPEDIFQQTEQMLKQQGFAIVESQLYGNPPQWMEKDSSVIYYDDANLSIATEIAAQLKKKLNKNFKILKGAIFSEIKGQESTRLIVHHLQSSN
ncbi:hypothetical protein APA_4137 [Pseudanabaena sp. lw0831]|uniref:LytR C-terminal domain-containing protein n=1 Tax=Pseudanabaena sp. lw0831 TaxID=1357935 RepID=UPI001915B27F|nr:LytR C-terminal domain-containing protein [Pseudanabaena sp. lw0831]GBO55931.1 hypothetical protein APA_4137 [Pseudanabaena sp. lw0831]